MRLSSMYLPRLVLAAAALVAVAASPVATAQDQPYRESSQAPAHWAQFAKLVKFRFETWVGEDEPIADRFRTYLKAHAGTSDGPPESLVVRAWINPDGTVERVSFPDLPDTGATRDLRLILTRGNIGEAPPPEMLQPLNLRFAVNLGK
ncbi:MAG: hypothetical protein HXX10_18835 [Rhodoplanes sp.]|nr:hypothetical protein [Rhodoplanes sp.]